MNSASISHALLSAFAEKLDRLEAVLDTWACRGMTEVMFSTCREATDSSGCFAIS